MLTVTAARDTTSDGGAARVTGRGGEFLDRALAAGYDVLARALALETDRPDSLLIHGCHKAVAGILGDIAADRQQTCVVLAVLRIASANAFYHRRETGAPDRLMVHPGAHDHRIRKSRPLITSPLRGFPVTRDPRTRPGHQGETSPPRHLADTATFHLLLDPVRLETGHHMAVQSVAQRVPTIAMSSTLEMTLTQGEGRDLRSNPAYPITLLHIILHRHHEDPRLLQISIDLAGRPRGREVGLQLI